MGDLLKEISARLRELRPHVEQYRRLEIAAAALDGVPESPRAGIDALAPIAGRRVTTQSPPPAYRSGLKARAGGRPSVCKAGRQAAQREDVRSRARGASGISELRPTGLGSMPPFVEPLFVEELGHAHDQP